MSLQEMKLSEVFEALLDPWQPASAGRLRSQQVFEGAKDTFGITKLMRRDLANALGVTTRTLKNWETHASIPEDQDVARLIEALTSHHRDAWAPGAFLEWKRRVGNVIRARIQEARDSRHPEPRQAPARDALPVLELAQLDRLPVRRDVEVVELWYGSEQTEVREGVEKLVTLPTGQAMVHHFGPGMAHLAPRTLKEAEELARDRLLFVPRAFWVRFKVPDPTIQYRTIVYIDIPYGSHHDVVSMDGYASQNLICRGGLAAFMDLRGTMYGPSPSEPLNGCGCAAVVVAVAYRKGKPVSRSESVLVVRRGVLLPDDVFLASNRRPFESWPGNLSASRVLLQSRNPIGGTSVYAMDLDGGQLARLANDERSVAWECLTDGAGGDIAKWLPNGVVQFGKRSGPNGAVELVQHRDPLWNARVNTPPPL
jgi:hypothetical protein